MVPDLLWGPRVLQRFPEVIGFAKLNSKLAKLPGAGSDAKGSDSQAHSFHWDGVAMCFKIVH